MMVNKLINQFLRLEMMGLTLNSPPDFVPDMSPPIPPSQTSMRPSSDQLQMPFSAPTDTRHCQESPWHVSLHPSIERLRIIEIIWISFPQTLHIVIIKVILMRGHIPQQIEISIVKPVVSLVQRVIPGVTQIEPIGIVLPIGQESGECVEMHLTHQRGVAVSVHCHVHGVRCHVIKIVH